MSDEAEGVWKVKACRSRRALWVMLHLHLVNEGEGEKNWEGKEQMHRCEAVL